MSYQHVHEGPYPPPGYAPPPPGPEGYPPPGQPEPFGYYGEAPPPPPPPGPPSYQGYFNDQYPPPDHIHHDQQPDHHSSGCCSFLKGWIYRSTLRMVGQFSISRRKFGYSLLLLFVGAVLQLPLICWMPRF
ncbi:hypothetical protein EJD97_001560 [Solanum chilense]|uniref:Uncharacterized protein n=1 Tax=Solanum chilense TaxID=4083 RepID=A0A6N2C5M0_SOLCI|nr:hypothetical protein EJD97_001560 [Solanum chilense]